MLKPSPSQRPIPDAAYWNQLRDCYFAAKADSDDPHDRELRHTFVQYSAQNKNNKNPNMGCYDGMTIQVRQGDYGRGLFTQAFIKKGTPVWRCNQYGIFRTQTQWDTFLSRLPPFMQYDVLSWAYVLEWDQSDCKQVVGLDLEPASLMNHGGTNVSDIDSTIQNTKTQPANLECVEIPNSDDEWHYIAVTDIQPNQELLCDYSKFHVYHHDLYWFDDAWDWIVEKEVYYPLSCWQKVQKTLTRGW